MSNQPVYRRPPRSHAYSCRCPRCAPFRSRSGGGGAGILVPLFAVMIFAVWPYAVWHGCKYGGGSGLSACGAESEWVWNGQTWAACGIWWLALGTVVTLVVADRRKRVAPPVVTPERLPPPPASISVPPPACRHLNAEPLTNSVSLAPVGWYCAECDTGLPRDFGDQRRPCCGTEPGTFHWYSCPESPTGTNWKGTRR